jgi:hypothetical protein
VGVHDGGGSAAELQLGLTGWKALLAAAGVPDSRLHDARHTAATVRAGCAGADGDERYGLVQHVDGGSVSARYGPDPAGGGRQGRWPPVGSCEGPGG